MFSFCRHYLEIRPPPLNLNVLDQVCCVLIRITSCSLNFLIKPCRDYWSHLYWSWRYPCCCPGFCSNFGHTRDRSWACKGMASFSQKVHSYWYGCTSRVLHHVLTEVRQPWYSWRFMWRIVLGKLHPWVCMVNIRVWDYLIQTINFWPHAWYNKDLVLLPKPTMKL
jgi:hypothetical protein